ncbi:MAG: class I SAM-dependent methyltransferase [Candidatus Methanofastidiosa archaeon]|jgi:SAM-dependent methyltransferase|nr:class I SAM-dependent methyltransferase [Candidatus Methanofastidiosa archaeon]
MDKRRFYDSLSQDYDKRYSDELNKKMRKEEENLLMNLPKGLSLDIGCGTGYHSKILKKNGHEVVCADISYEMIKKARNNSAGDFFLVADIEKLPFKEKKFDNVISIFGALNHANINNFKDSLTPILKKEGNLIFTVGNIYNLFWMLKSIKEGKNPFRAIKKRKGKISVFTGGKKISVRIRYYSLDEISDVFKEYDIKLGALYPKLTFIPVLNKYGRYIVLIGRKSF